MEMKDIVKQYPGVLALDNVSFNLRAGEVMALLGENGAGKSTLVKILSGVQSRDSGDVTVFGQQLGNINTKIAMELGIAIIHQELNMCGHLTVAENIFLGRELSSGGLLNKGLMRKKSKEVLDRLNIDISPDTILGDMPVSKQQMVEIAKALSKDAKILIMDEPTSALTDKEINDLFKIITKLKSEGVGIIYISHRLDELSHITDRVTIMRDGKFILCENFNDISMDDIITNMVGREIKEKFPRVECERGKKVLEVKNLNAGKLVREINFDLYAGEIVGFAGLMGAGRTEMSRALFGVDKKEYGEIILDGKEIRIKNPRSAIRSGLVLAPEDRKKDGLCTRLSVKDNIALPNLDIICKTGIVDNKKQKTIVNDTVKKLNIKLPNVEVNSGSLSGGNQQKVVVGKWLVRDSRVVIFDEPTRGIDVAAKVEIYNIMNKLKQQGVAVMFISSEMPEVLGVADRILVMCDGKITGELDAKNASQKEILECATMFDKKITTIA